VADTRATPLLAHVDPVEHHHPATLGSEELVPETPSDHRLGVERDECVRPRILQEQVGSRRIDVLEGAEGAMQELLVTRRELADLHVVDDGSTCVPGRR
jgi:hypothetical protein